MANRSVHSSAPSAPRRRSRRRARPAAAGTALLRLFGAALLAFLLFAFIEPLRGAAVFAGDSILDAVFAGQAAGAHRRSVANYALQYGISPDLAVAIYHAALEEEINPNLAFRLVRVESEFKETAVSSAGALGLTQLMPATADALRSGITRDQILDRDTNLRLGFRYLRWLLRVYKGDVNEALHAYNRGPGTVARIRAAGGDPANGYADRVTSGNALLNSYRGTGLLPTRRAAPRFSF